jgi:thiopurine S-methyltransferase
MSGDAPDDSATVDRANWIQRWREGRIGFHQPTPSPLLVEFWEAIGVPAGARVFVPLAGKTVDMPWLAERGHRVFGVELAPMAVAQFFEALDPRLRGDDGSGDDLVVERTPKGTLTRAGPIEMLCGDVFALDERDLADCAAVFDRAALIALPPDLRRRYARETYARLRPGCIGLLITLEYPPHQKQGPPFSVPEAEVRELFGQAWTLDVLARRDILPYQAAFREEGVTALSAVAYRMQRR